MSSHPAGDELPDERRVPLTTIAAQWLRLGCIGFGGPPTHISLLRRMCVEERRWIDAVEFEDAIAAVNLLPGPASTQLAIYCAWRLRRRTGGVVGGICFIVPGLIVILALSAVFLAKHPPGWILGAASGAGAAVPAVALRAAWSLLPASWARIGSERGDKARWIVYAAIGAAAAATLGTYLVLFLVASGFCEIVLRRGKRPSPPRTLRSVAAVVFFGGLTSSVGALVWVALKVGALSYGGGFVIVPLMQHDAVTTYHWMTGAQFLDAVALGQITPGPVVQTVAVVGYAAGGIIGGLAAAVVAFAPSFLFVLLGGRHFDSLRVNSAVVSFLAGAGPAVIGAIAGSAIPLGLSFTHTWQIIVLGASVGWLFVLKRDVVSCLVVAGVIGAVIALAGL